MSQKSLLKFQIGPVQDFIAAARSTRDLWSGSYLLSWLVATGIKAIPNYRETLIFPNPEGQPLLKEILNPDAEGILISNLPNIFIARIEGDAKAIAKDVEKAIRAEWIKIVNSVWAKHKDFGIPADRTDVFSLSVKNHLAISWQITKFEDSDYAQAYRTNGWHLDAVRQTRQFNAWGGGKVRTGVEKDSLTGKEEAIGGGTTTNGEDYSTIVAEQYKRLFKHNDHFGAITLIKRVWHLTYLKDEKKLETDSENFKIRSIPAIAARTEELDDDPDASEIEGGDKYVAVIAFDGDSIGAWVNGDNSPPGIDLLQHHQSFSRYLSNFALGKAREIVEGTKTEQDEGKVLGQLIYAGGDDVVALVPADAAIEIAEKLRQAFCDATKKTPATGEKPDASAGISIGHIHAPLQDLIREAQTAEKRAKNEVGRPAFSVTLMKRSGEISYWGSKWESGGIELYRQIVDLMNDKQLSAKFPHRVIELLEVYLTHNKGFSKLVDAIDDVNLVKELIHKEFAHTATRQGSKSVAENLAMPLTRYLDLIIEERSKKEEQNKKDGKEPIKATLFQELLTSLIGLCTTVAFANRTQNEKVTIAEEQIPNNA